jgi:hypothetical protein
MLGRTSQRRSLPLAVLTPLAPARGADSEVVLTGRNFFYEVAVFDH